MWTAALRLDDPGISEAHALVSLRGATLRLLALRGRFLVDGQPSAEITLAAGQRIRLSPDVELVVEEVVLPDAVMAIEGDGVPQQILGGTCSIVCRPHPRLVPGAEAGAEAVLWSTGERWRIRTGQEPARDLLPGDTWQIRGRTFRAVAVALAQAGQHRTRMGVDAPLRIVAQFDTVHIHRNEATPLVLTGQQARIISELVTVGGPISWESLARELWSDDLDRDALRRRWDVCLVRLRNRLRDAGLRPDLVQPSRTGQVELVLAPGDVVEDRT